MCSVSARTNGTASEPERLASAASASGAGRRSAQTRAMMFAASGGTMPASASAAASARSKSSIARTNASADSAWVNASRAKPRPTMFTSARALELDEQRFAGAPQADVPAIDPRIAGIANRDQRAQPLGIADRAGQRIVLHHFERSEEHARVQGTEEPAGEERADRLRGGGLRHRYTPIGVARGPRSTMSQR